MPCIGKIGRHTSRDSPSSKFFQRGRRQLLLRFSAATLSRQALSAVRQLRSPVVALLEIALLAGALVLFAGGAVALPDWLPSPLAWFCSSSSIEG